MSAQPYVPGIDVSRWQGDINWNSVRSSGVRFAFCKATEGVDFVDIKYVQNMNNASAAGVLIGPYHFARPDSAESNPNDAIDEANDFVDAIQPYYEQPGNFLRPVLDVERLPTLGEIPAGMTQRQYLSEWVHDFAGVVQTRLGVEPIIYTGSLYALNYLEPSVSQYDLWIANWGYAPPSEPPVSQLGIWNDWTIWQFTDSGSVPGISGGVDLDVFEGTVLELMQYVPNPFIPSGDFNHDGDVDGRDFLAWQRGFGKTAGASLAQGDANRDGAVDNADLVIWQTQYGLPQLTTMQAVPEQSTIFLATLLSLLLTTQGRISARLR